MRHALVLMLMALGLSAGTARAGSEAAIDTAPHGAELFGQRCAACHDHPTGRIPPHYVLSHLSADQVRRALTTGAMRQQAQGLGPDDISQLVVFVTYKTTGSWDQPDPQANICKGPATLTASGTDWSGWGHDPENTRFESDPGIATANVPRLKLKWAFAYPGSEAVGQPARMGDMLFVPSVTGRIFALDAKTGCTYWTVDAGAPVKTAIAVGATKPGQTIAVFGDMAGFVHAVDALTGRALWTVKADPHPLAQVRGSPRIYDGRVYAPVSSGEESAAVDAAYPCCTFRGALVAFDGATGKIIWKAYTILNEPAKLKINSAGTQMYGPSGAPTWSSPTVDVKRRRIYIGTGNGYSGADTGTSDAVMAFDLDTGKRIWATQTTKDVFVVCARPHTGNCPDEQGKDIDFASSSVLETLPDGKQLLLAGQKSGVVFGFDPDHDGKIVWKTKLGEGGPFGGVEHGVAADGERLYVPISDVAPSSAIPEPGKPPHPEGGLSALSPATGAKIWRAPAPTAVCSWGTVSCSAAQPAAVTAIPGMVFSGSLDGHIRAYRAADGKVAWDFDTGRNFGAVNGGLAHGGAVNGFGQIVSGGMLYVNSGGGYYGPAGNALLAFSVDGQ
jgi:polyvinyl alcohol dehydrogenase (cytochrome)